MNNPYNVNSASYFGLGRPFSFLYNMVTLNVINDNNQTQIETQTRKRTSSAVVTVNVESELKSREVSRFEASVNNSPENLPIVSAVIVDEGNAAKRPKVSKREISINDLPENCLIEIFKAIKIFEAMRCSEKFVELRSVSRSFLHAMYLSECILRFFFKGSDLLDWSPNFQTHTLFSSDPNVKDVNTGQHLSVLENPGPLPINLIIDTELSAKRFLQFIESSFYDPILSRFESISATLTSFGFYLSIEKRLNEQSQKLPKLSSLSFNKLGRRIEPKIVKLNFSDNLECLTSLNISGLEVNKLVCSLPKSLMSFTVVNLTCIDFEIQEFSENLIKFFVSGTVYRKLTLPKLSSKLVCLDLHIREVRAQVAMSSEFPASLISFKYSPVGNLALAAKYDEWKAQVDSKEQVTIESQGS